MGFKKDHEENRLKICAPCGKKVPRGKVGRISTEFSITAKYEELIRKHMNKHFQISDVRFPLSICGSCRIALSQYEAKRCRLPTMPNYLDIELPRESRENHSECSCLICITSRTKGKQVMIKDSGNNTNTPQFQSAGTPQSQSTVEVRKNVMKAIEQLPEKQQEQIASSILSKKLKRDHQNVAIDVSTQGRKLRLTVNPEKKKEAFFSTEKLDNYRVNTGASGKDMRKLTNFIQSTVGRKSIPPYYRDHVSKQSKELEDIYKHGLYEFDTGGTCKENRPVVWADATELLDTVIEKRGMVGNVLVKVMLDGGQNSFKICMAVLPENYSEELNNLEAEGKRNRYSAGGSTSKKSKLTSVNRLILLCVVPSIKETYENIKIIFDLTNVNNISYKLVGDFKIILIINGQQTASSTYPCPYCFITLTDMKVICTDSRVVNINSDEEEDNTNEIKILDTSENCLRLKTYGDLKEDYRKFEAFGKNKKFAKNFHSTINPPLVNEEDDVLVIQKCIVPELHILQGIVNHIFWDGLVPLIGEEKALMWPKKFCAIPKNYQGRTFEGNACRDMLKNSDALLDKEFHKTTDDYYKLVPFVSACKAMEKIVTSCFSTQEVKPGIDKHIAELKKAWESTKLSQTLKVHVLLEHLTQCLHFLDETGLGIWSEQAGESVHREFLITWNRYKINIIDDPSYAEKLKKAVVEFSSLRI